jgi:diphthamide biosynthesis methyltransferase
MKFDFGPAPHALVFLGELHFMEAEALVILAKGPPEIRHMAK